MNRHIQIIKKRKLLFILYKTKVVKFFKDGDGIGGVFNYYHPLTYIVLPILFIIAVLLQGIPDTLEHIHEIGVKLSPHWKKKEDQIEWL